MAVDLAWLLEHIDTESPGDLNIAPGATEATLFFIIDEPKLISSFYYILGYSRFSNKVWPNGAVGGLTRQIEMSHPRYPYLYAESVDIVGISPNGSQSASNFVYAGDIFNTNNPDQKIPVDYKTFRNIDVYRQYRIQVKFTTRNYFLLTDDQLSTAIAQPGRGPERLWYYVRDNLKATGVRQESYFDFREYLRYTELNIEPSNEILANSNGKLYWKSIRQGNLESIQPSPEGESPVGFESSPVKFVNVTKNNIKIKWYKVPKKTILNPMYLDFAATVNFGANYDDDAGRYDIFNYELFNFAPGTLLFLGITSEDVNSSFPTIRYGAKNDIDLFNNVLDNTYVNITLNFAQFVVPKNQLVLPALSSIEVPNNGKMLSNGWNFVPAPNQKFYYIESGSVADKKNAWPPYWSAPHQRLWNPQAK